MKTIAKLSDLTVQELRKIRDTLCSRYGVGKRGNVIEIGFGVAEKGGAVDLQRRDAVCFHVGKKCKPRAKRDQIPDVLEVRVERNGKYVGVCLKTDVILTRRSALHLTGRSIRHLSKRDIATAGCIVVWRTSATEPFLWGVMTVGHLFSQITTVPQTTPQVRVLIPRSSSQPNDREIEGTLLARTLKNDGNHADAALVQVKKNHLVIAGVLPQKPSTRARQVRKVSSLKADPGRHGLSLPADDQVGFVVKRYYPEFNLISAVGRLDQVIDVESSVGNTFGPGLSGTIWIISQQGSCLQFAGWEVPGHPSQNFKTGSGQSLETILQWARASLAKIEQVAVSDVELRLVRRL